MSNDYFRDKIERRLAFIETQARLIDAPYIAEVERLAKQTRDDDWRRFFRETMTADSILTACLQVRLQLQLGEVDGADRRLEILESRIRFVDSRLTRRFFMAGFKAVEGGRDGARRSHGSAAARRSRTAKGKKVRAAWAAERANGKTKTEADEVVALKFKISTKTVRNFRAEK